MTIRTTIAFDPATAARLERLAKRWGVSKSETLRRALESAEMQGPALEGAPLPSEGEIAAMTPRDALAWLRAHPQQPAGWGEKFRTQLQEDRERDAEIEDQRVAETTARYQAADPGNKP